MQTNRKLNYLSKQAAVTGPKTGFCQIIADSWWVVDPEQGLVFYHFPREHGLGSPQCNTNKLIVEDFIKKWYPEGQLEYFDRVIVPIDLRDYTDY